MFFKMNLKEHVGQKKKKKKSGNLKTVREPVGSY